VVADRVDVVVVLLERGWVTEETVELRELGKAIIKEDQTGDQQVT
jgi:hypothetical protein